MFDIYLTTLSTWYLPCPALTRHGRFSAFHLLAPSPDASCRLVRSVEGRLRKRDRGRSCRAPAARGQHGSHSARPLPSKVTSSFVMPCRECWEVEAASPTPSGTRCTFDLERAMAPAAPRCSALAVTLGCGRWIRCQPAVEETKLRSALKALAALRPPAPRLLLRRARAPFPGNADWETSSAFR